MGPFVVDYAMQRGHEMLITREPPFKREDMDEIDLQMLQAETVPSLLRIDWLEIDGCFQLRYGLSGKRMLSQRLMAQPLRMEDYYDLLIGVIEALDECRHYLLRESCCLLDERYLFVGERWSDVWVAYVPLREGCATQPIHETLLGLAARWGARVTGVEGSGLQAVLQLLEKATPLPDLRNALMAHRGGDYSRSGNSAAAFADASAEARGSVGAGSGYGAAAGEAAAAAAAQIGGAKRPLTAGRRGIDAAASTNPLEQRNAVHDMHGGHEDEVRRLHGREGVMDQADRPAVQGKRQREAERSMPAEPTGFLDREWRTERGIRTDAARARWLSGALAVVLCACCWRFVYLPSPGMAKLLVCIGLTLLLVWGVITLWAKLGGTSEPLRGIPLDELDAEKDSGGWSWGQRSPASFGTQSPEAQHGDAKRRGMKELASASQGARGDDEAYAFDLASEQMPSEPLDGAWETDYLAADAADETALLGASPAAEPGDEESWLIREHRGGTQRIPLQAGLSVIGRSAEIAHIVDAGDGVSRTHLELEWDGGRLKARDLASRNGSRLNGTAMVPYKLYELKHADCIQLAGDDGPRYTWGAAGPA